MATTTREGEADGGALQADADVLDEQPEAIMSPSACEHLR